MEKCKICINYDDNKTYPNTGYCHLYELYVKEDISCEDLLCDWLYGHIKILGNIYENQDLEDLEMETQAEYKVNTEKMTNEEAIRVIKANYPPSNFTMLREALDISIELLGTTNNTNIKDKQLQIINHYGFDNQLDQLIEECGELIVSISKNKRYISSENCLAYYENVVEELADVKNLIEQLELLDRHLKEGIEVMIKHKVNRELERIRR